LKDQTDVSNIDREKLETIADTLGIDYSNKNDDELRNAINKEVTKERK
jgi:sec-independent protein translocase protein TatA